MDKVGRSQAAGSAEEGEEDGEGRLRRSGRSKVEFAEAVKRDLPRLY
jgi:hypothetical protein